MDKFLLYGEHKVDNYEIWMLYDVSVIVDIIVIIIIIINTFIKQAMITEVQFQLIQSLNDLRVQLKLNYLQHLFITKILVCKQ